MKSTILGVVLLSARFLTILTAPVAPGQENCVEGDPIPGETQPDVNLRVLPSTNIPRLSNISVNCNSPTPGVNLTIFIGPFQVERCNNAAQCVYNLQTYFPTLPRAISCTATNAGGACRFKVLNVALTEATTTVPPTTAPRTTVASTAAPSTPPVPTTAAKTTKKKDDDDSDDESDDDSDDDSDSD